MGSEGSTEAELVSEKTGVREKTPKVPASSKPVGSEEEGPATLGCASACACVCSLWWTNNEDSVVNQVLNDIPKSMAIICRVSRGSMVIAVLARIVTPWKRVWWQASFREP